MADNDEIKNMFSDLQMDSKQDNKSMENLFNPISDPEKAEDTSVAIDLDKTYKEVPPAKEEPIKNLFEDVEPSIDEVSDKEDTFYNVISSFDEIGDRRDEIDEYENETGNKVIDYADEYDRTINNTGTALDGKSVDEVAVSKQTTPKKIFETRDVLEQWSYGVYDFCRNATKLASWGIGEVATSAVDYAMGQPHTPVSEGELKQSNIADFGEPPEARSVAGAITKPIAQFASGSVALGGLGSITGASKGTQILINSAKTPFGKVAITGTSEFMKGMANEAISFSENSENFSELSKKLGFNISKDLLVKNPEDSYFMKKLKNSMDGGAANLIFNALVGSSKVFVGAPVKKVKAINKEIEAATNVSVLPYTQTKQLLQASNIKKEIAESVLNKHALLETIDIANKTTKGLTQQEKESIYKSVVFDMSDDAGIETAERIANIDIKKLNKEQFEQTVYYKQKEIVEGQVVVDESKDFSAKILKGDVNEKQINDFAIEKLTKLINNRKDTIEAVSGPAQSLAEVSASAMARRMNRLISYISDNADKLDGRKLIDLMSSLSSPKDFDMFFGIANNALKHGKIEQLFDKITWVRQNIMLASGVTQIKDLSSTLGHRVLEWGDIATATGIKNVFVKPYRAVKKTFTKADQVSAKIRLGMGDVDDVELKEILDNIIGMGEFLEDATKFRYRKITGQLAAGEISPTARHIKQVGSSASKYNFKKNIDLDVLPGNNVFSRQINGIINHSGVAVSEAKDDVVQAMLHQADIRTYIGSLARRELRAGRITEEQVDDFIRNYLKSSESWAGSASKKIPDFAEGLTDSMRLDSIMKRAGESSGITTFRSQLTGATKDVYDAINRHAILRVPLRLIAPFQKTGLVIAVERAMKERSAFALLNPNLYRAISRGGRDAQMAVARLTNGLAIQGAVAWQMYKGNIIGPMPKNKGERELLQAAGATEYSVKVGDKYYSLTDVAGPAAPLIKQSLAITDAVIRKNIQIDEHPEDESGYQDMVLGLASIFMESPLMTTMYGGILENAERGDLFSLKNTIRSFASGPRIINEVKSATSRMSDLFGIETDVGRNARYKKASYDFVDALNTNWGISEGHYRRDIFGYKVPATEMSYVGLMSSRAVNDPVTYEMIYRKAFVYPPSNTFEYDNVSIVITDEEKDMWYQKMADLGVYQKLESLINSRAYKNLPESEYDMNKMKQKTKTDVLREEYNKVKREAAKKLIDEDAIVGLKYKQAKEFVPTINLNPYMEMLK